MEKLIALFIIINLVVNTNIEGLNINKDINLNKDIVKNENISFTTEFNFCHLTSRCDKNLVEVEYERFVYEDNEIVVARGNSPYFKQSGKAIFKNNKSSYYIPIYELQEGLNIIKYREIYSDGTIQNKEHIIEKIASEYDKMYEEKEIKKTNNLSLVTYQKEINVNMNDYNTFLITGSFYTPNDIISIKYIQYEHPVGIPGKTIDDEEAIKEYLASWEKVGVEYGGSYNPNKEARIYGNYWTIDLFNLSKSGNKIDIIAVDSKGNEVKETVYIYNNSNDEDIIFEDDIDESEINDDGSVSNRFCIYFNSNVKQERCEEIIKEIDGTIVGGAFSIQWYIVNLNNERYNSYEKFEEYCEKLKSTYYEIEDAYPDMMMEISFD